MPKEKKIVGQGKGIKVTGPVMEKRMDYLGDRNIERKKKDLSPVKRAVGTKLPIRMTSRDGTEEIIRKEFEREKRRNPKK